MVVKRKEKPAPTTVIYSVLPETAKLRETSTYEFNATEFGLLVGVSDQTLTNWVGEGMPDARRPIKNSCYYDLKIHLPWIIENKWKPNQTARARKQEADAAMAEMERDTMAGILIPVPQVQRQWEDTLAKLRTNLRGLPARLIPLLEEVSTEREKMAIGVREIDIVLRGITEQES